jgi:hypothetical protein
MRLLVVYRPNSEFARVVETFIHDYQRIHETPNRKLEVQTTESRDGAHTLQLYGLYEQPCILILGDDGQLVKNWSGGQLPLMDEVAGYFAMANS